MQPYRGFWDGYNDQTAADDRASMVALNQLTQVKALQSEARTRQALAQSGGDPETAIKSLISAGDIRGAHELGQLLQAQSVADQRRQQAEHRRQFDAMIAPGGTVDDPALERLALRMGVDGSPGASAILGLVEKRKQAREYADAMKRFTAPGAGPAAQPAAPDVQLSPGEAAAVEREAPENRAALVTALKNNAAGRNVVVRANQPNVNTVADTNAPLPATAAPGNGPPGLPSDQEIMAMVSSPNPQLQAMGKFYEQQKFNWALTQNKQGFQRTERVEGQTYRTGERTATEQARERLVRLQNEIKNGASASSFSPDDLSFLAQQALAGDTSVFTNLGRGAQGAADVTALRRAVIREAAKRGMTPEDTANRVAGFFGQKAAERSLGTRVAGMETARVEAESMADMVEETSANVPRTEYQPVNKALNAYHTKTGSVPIREFGAALNSFVNAYTRAISPTGTPTVSDKEHAREMLSTADSHEQLLGILEVMRREMKLAGASPGKAREAIRRDSPLPAQIPGRGGASGAGEGGSPAPAPETQPRAASQAAGPVAVTQSMPDPAKFNGKWMKDPTGAWFQSDGTRWVKR